MKVLALDQSSNISGYAYFNDQELIEYNILDVSNFGKAIDRMCMVVQWIDWFIKKNEVDLIVFEDVVLQNEAKYKKTEQYKENHTDEESVDNILTFQTLTKLLGILEYNCKIKNIKYKIKKPPAWRADCNIQGTKRHVVKQEAINFVKKKWNIDAKEDACEAICIGWSEVKPELKGWGTWGNK